MPVAKAAERIKRKRSSVADQPKKRQRSSSAESEDPSEEILLLEQRILESRKNYNDIITLQKYTEDSGDGDSSSVLAAVALCRVFIRLLTQGSLTFKKNMSEKDEVVMGWLKDQLSQYKATLLSLLRDGEVAPTALTLCMRILKAEGECSHDKEEYSFPQNFFAEIVGAVLQSKEEEVRSAFVAEAEQYDDIRYFTFKAIKVNVESMSKEKAPTWLFDHVMSVMSALDGVPESAEELEDFYLPEPKKKGHPLRSVHQHKKQAQEAWQAVMGIAHGREQQKRLLDIISTVIAPWFAKPELLADFLTNCYNSGGSISILALSGVFYLINERNLDYPSFYTKLYSLLDADILHSKHRSRFFRLLDTFLGSTHLPAGLVASFVKRLSRLALNAPPSAIVSVIPWIYNLLKRHPSCTYLVHRESRDPQRRRDLQEHGFKDPFIPDEGDPTATKAIESSLWELVQLQSHYHPNVATIAKIVSEQFTKHAYNMEDFLDHSYASLLDAELGKEVKKAPVVEFQIPKRVFLPQDNPTSEPDSLLVKLWDFGSSGTATEVV